MDFIVEVDVRKGTTEVVERQTATPAHQVDGFDVAGIAVGKVAQDPVELALHDVWRRVSAHNQERDQDDGDTTKCWKASH